MKCIVNKLVADEHKYGTIFANPKANLMKPLKHMRSYFTLFSFATTLLLSAQYGTFDAAKAKSVSSSEIVVVLAEGNAMLSTAVRNAVSQHWTMGDPSYATTSDLETSGYEAGKTYLIHAFVNHPKTFGMNYLSLVEGWKMKKSERVQIEEGKAVGIPAERVIASILFDPAIAEGGRASMVNLYVKHLQDYVKQVASGKITDETTANRLYQKRNRTVKESTIQLCSSDMDKTFPAEKESVEELYPYTYSIVPEAELAESVNSRNDELNVGDVVITGEHKTKHCFKRVFNTASGELMYLADEPALYGKKEGFLLDDLKTIAKSR